MRMTLKSPGRRVGASCSSPWSCGSCSCPPPSGTRSSTIIAAALHGRGGPRPQALLLERLQLLPHAVRASAGRRRWARRRWAATTSSTGPHLLGSERTGPDLSYIGRKRSEAWELQHLKHPRDALAAVDHAELLPAVRQGPARHRRLSSSRRATASAQQRMVPPENTAYLGKTDPVGYPDGQTVTEGVDQGWPTWNAAHLQEGKKIYVTRCMTCHGCAGNGLGTYGGHQVVTPVNFKADPYRGDARRRVDLARLGGRARARSCRSGRRA